MGSELRKLSGLLRREIRGKRLPTWRTGHATRVLEGTTPRAEVKAQLEQPRPLDRQETAREMDPDPLADNLRIPPLPRDALPDEGKDLGEGQGPMLPMQRPLERARKLDHGSGGRSAEAGGRTR